MKVSCQQKLGFEEDALKHGGAAEHAEKPGNKMGRIQMWTVGSFKTDYVLDALLV